MQVDAQRALDKANDLDGQIGQIYTLLMTSLWTMVLVASATVAAAWYEATYGVLTSIGLAIASAVMCFALFRIISLLRDRNTVSQLLMEEFHRRAWLLRPVVSLAQYLAGARRR